MGHRGALIRFALRYRIEVGGKFRDQFLILRENPKHSTPEALA
jgi:hypothetical protein